MKNIAITGGGTGGHLFASLSFAKYVKKLGYNPIIIGSVFGIENTLLKKYDYEYILLKTKGFSGKSKKEKLISSINLLNATIKMTTILKKKKPVFSIGFGGYTTLPVIFASKIAGIKSAIVEQNSIAGKANRLLSRISDAVFVNFETTKSQFVNKNTFVVGNPVRSEIYIDKRYFNKKRYIIGIMGGSRGARSINSAMANLAEYSSIDIKVIHQTGKEDFKKIEAIYAKHKPDWQAFPFIDDMSEFYKNIDFIVCRAGASTLSEIACASLGSLLIPYPYAIYNHQYYNAMEFVKRGAAILLEDKKISGKIIENVISSLNESKLRVLSDNAKSMCKRSVCEIIFETIQML